MASSVRENNQDDAMNTGNDFSSSDTQYERERIIASQSMEMQLESSCVEYEIKL